MSQSSAEQSPIWRASVLTLFPELFPGPLAASLAGKALAEGIWSLDAIDIRGFATDRHRTVDDTPYCGGAGMVMKPGPFFEAVEKFSVVKTLQAIEEANVVILVLDAQAGVAEQDATLAGYVLEQGRALVVAVNKWDALDAPAREWLTRELHRKLDFLVFASAHYISALRGEGIAALFPSVDRAYASAHASLSTPRLNRVLQQAVQATPPPLIRGRRPRLKYAHQGGKNPPRIVVHGNLVAALPKAYRRYLANAFRKAFRLEGAPVRIECRQEENPYRPRPGATKKTSTKKSDRAGGGRRARIYKNKMV